jgi:acetylornithine deacetylase/succinyl-diaminopimelate desuccinylase-like protein
MAAAGGLAYVLGVGEKGRLQAEFTVKGTSAHASVPWQGTNASYRLAELIRRIGAYEPDLDTSLEIFQHLSTFAIEHKPSPDNIEDILVEVEPDNPDLASVLRALSRMTVTPTMVQGGVKSNSVPESIGLTCDIRSLPHQDETYISEQLAGIMEGVPDTELNLDFMAVANSSPFETGFVDRIKNAMSMALGRDDIRWVPGLSTGFTDSRFTRQLGIDTYGFSGRHPDDDPLEEKVHGTDESIGIRSLVSGTRAMVSLAYDMLAER